MKRTGAISIKDLVQQAIDENKLNDGLDKVRVKSLWKEVCGTYVANATTDIQINSSRLFVSVNSSIIRSELLLIRSELVKRLNKNLGREFIKEIIIR
ncbi:MAG: DUF721 domain-containing protein [Marinilabiliales bacterium]|nr:MAG: DUF721 domain-containing protein [Marinilabiliales bacterium]